MPECPECRRYWRPGNFKNLELKTYCLKDKLNNKYEAVKRYKEQLEKN